MSINRRDSLLIERTRYEDPFQAETIALVTNLTLFIPVSYSYFDKIIYCAQMPSVTKVSYTLGRNANLRHL